MKPFCRLSFKERTVFLALLEHSKLFLEYCKKNNLPENEYDSKLSFIEDRMYRKFFIDTKNCFDFAIPYKGMTYYDDLMDGHSYATYYEE